MKTQQIHPLAATSKITFLLLLLFIASCKSKDDSSQKAGLSDSSQVDVKAPAVDIHTAVITENLEALKQHIAAGTNINEKDPLEGQVH